MQSSKWQFKVLSFLILLLTWPSPVSAHAFGQTYTLPLPFWLYSYGAAAALIVSFLMIGFFIKDSSRLTFPKISLNINPLIILFSKLLSLTLLLITILAGFIGSPYPYENFALNFFWIILFLGFSYLQVIFGNIWEVVNPWKIIISWLGNIKPLFSYPKFLGYFPALFFYFSLIWLELISPSVATVPKNLSLILLAYSTLTFLGVMLFGKQVWFKYGEFFSVFFNLISKLSFFSKDDFTKQKAESISLLLFILFMLSSTAFDGFRSTEIYLRYFYDFSPTILLLFSPLFFLVLYLITIFIMKSFTQINYSIKELSLYFAYSLIPIAIAYNVAHYFTLVLVQGQFIIPLLSDPFNKGWNLFGTASYQINVGVVSASFVWHFQVAVIIIGHILAVIIAHTLALNLFTKRRIALISQVPLLILMVIYTTFGLWLLSQPLTLNH